jgi:hypothetical protein
MTLGMMQVTTPDWLAAGSKQHARQQEEIFFRLVYPRTYPASVALRLWEVHTYLPEYGPPDAGWLLRAHSYWKARK